MSNSTAAQCVRLLEALQRGPINTISARRDLDVMHPAGRIKDLRRMGYPITTAWQRAATDCGRFHQVANGGVR